GIRHYDIQVRENGGDWDDWLTAVDYTGATFVGALDYTYTFRIKATDNVSNTTANWQVSQPTTVHGVTKYYTHGGSRVAMRRGDALYYLSGDHLGSTSLTTDETGNIVSEVRYLPYGEERWASGATPTDFTFTGQRNEAGFGLMDYNARYYNPRVGRFVSPDTVVPEPSGSQGWNRYAYVRNNPLKYTDPSGHGWEPRHCLVCTVKIDVSGWPNWAKKAGGFVGSVTIGGGYDAEQDAIVGPTPEEWVENALTDIGSPAPLSAVSKGAGKALSNLGEEVIEEATDDLLYRSMKKANDGLPEVGSSGRTLGVRPQDIPVENGMVRPNTGGMSVSPNSPHNLPPHRRPPEFGGTGKDPVFCIESSCLSDGLQYRPDPNNPTGHGFIEPSREMSSEEYQKLLGETRPLWSD
ncbi:MAG TPA: RHS repeat-associated core domain-containing protein, partial [Candidatus Saccharimonadales bacterium]